MGIRQFVLGLALAALFAGCAAAESSNADLVKRGSYLVNGILTCGNCHTPKGPNGDIMDKAFSGGLSWDEPPFKVTAPNITPDKETGIGSWKREEIAELILTGTKPDFDNVEGLMDEVIQGAPHGYKDMKKDDALAIADYLKSIPPIKNKIK